MDVSSISAIASTATQAQSSADLLAQSTTYSASVGGKNYTADISESSGEYVATVPNLPGVSASGSTLQAVENNLNASISVVA
jgi:hypothetical protein